MKAGSMVVFCSLKKRHEAPGIMFSNIYWLKTLWIKTLHTPQTFADFEWKPFQLVHLIIGGFALESPNNQVFFSWLRQIPLQNVFSVSFELLLFDLIG